MSHLNMRLLPLIISILAGSAVASFNYCSINAKNTMCIHKPTQIGKACTKLFPMNITATDKALIVNMHNKLRRQVAKGLEKRGSPGPQLAAANMREITWDDEVALMAQTHANQCVFNHDSNRDIARFKVGQNLAIQFSTKQMLKSNWTAMIQNWYDEVVAMKESYIKAFPSSPIGTIGHYTQLVWAETYKVGCGITSYYNTSLQPSFPYNLFYVCNYGPAGNFLGKPVYKSGIAASSCPSPTKAKDGLCA